MKFLPHQAKWQILVLIASSFSLSLLVFAWVSLSHVQDDIGLVARHQLALTKRIAHELDTRLESAKAALEALAGLLPSELPRGQAASSMLAQHLGLRTVFFDQGLLLFDVDGQLLGDTGVAEAGLEAFFKRWISLCVRLNVSIISIPVRLNPDQNSGAPILFTLIAVPIRNDRHEVSGVLVGALDLGKADILGSLGQQKLGKQGYFFISAWDKTLIAHPDARLLMRQDIFPVPEQLLEQASQGARAVVETTAHDGVQVLASLVKLQSTGWVLGGNLPSSEANALFYRQLVTLAAFVVLGAALAAVITWLLMRLFVKPLVHLAAQFRALDISGDELWLIQCQSQTVEIANLVKSFNHLIGRLNQNYHEMGLASNIFEHAHEGIMITDAEQKIVKVNAAFCRITGYLPQEVLGQSPKILSSGKEDYHVYQSMWQDIRRKGSWQGELWNRRYNGELYLEQLRISVVRNAEGQITNYVGVFTDLSEIREAKNMLETMASSDVLTGLPNRSTFVMHLEAAMAKLQPQGLLAVVYLDLDDFNSINTDHGQATGDQLLVEVARQLEAQVRAGDVVARLGGDEFMLLLGGRASPGEVQTTLGAMLERISQSYEIDGHRLEVGASMGVTFYPEDDSEAETLIRHAGQAMHTAKNNGRGQISYFDTLKSQVIQNHSYILERIREGLANNEMLLYYQPKVNLLSGQVIGAEALLRWQHPEQGLLSPPYFLEPFANHEVIIEIGNWVIAEALRQMSAWQRADLILPVSINLSARHLVWPGFNQDLRNQLNRYPDLWPQWLEIEILESDVLMDIAHVQQAIKEAQALGVSFALDDFGTGYSSLAYLKNIPANTLKIDRSFVRDMLQDKDDLAIVRGVIQLANVFHRQVVAEGVETAEHETLLLSIGCSQAQGYGIARPMPAADLPAWVMAYELGKTHPMQIRARCIKADGFSTRTEGE
jgi:diguanylate cyclase (GGDEF)-like protein/PAS domain S-box-containing protein